MGERADVWQGTLALMVLKTLQALGPLHGYGIARRIEQTDRKSTRLNSSHRTISYAVFCLKKKGKNPETKCRGLSFLLLHSHRDGGI